MRRQGSLADENFLVRASARVGTPAQARQAAEEQRRWLDSLQGICAFQVVAMTGQLGRADCLANETRKRADVLARQLSELVN